MNCSSCGAPLHDQDVDTWSQMAQCSHCQSVFDLTRLSGEDPSEAPAAEPPRPRAQLPEHFHVEHRGDGRLRIRHRTSELWGVGIALTIGGLAGAAVFGALAVMDFATSPTLDNLGDNLCSVGVALGFLAGGLSFGYATAAFRLNSMLIEVEEGRFQMRYEPLPWFGNMSVPAADIGQVFVLQTWEGDVNSPQQHKCYNLCALLRDGTQMGLMAFDEDEPARALEQEIESALGIADRRLPHERDQSP